MRKKCFEYIIVHPVRSLDWLSNYCSQHLLLYFLCPVIAVRVMIEVFPRLDFPADAKLLVIKRKVVPRLAN